MLGDEVRLESLVRRAVAADMESEWLEYKVGFDDAEVIGEYLSALSNGARLRGEPFGALIWGIEDQTRKLVGSKFDPFSKKGKGNEDLVPWLTRLIEPPVQFQFSVLDIDGTRVVVCAIEAALASPTSFKRQRWIRLQSYKKRLSEVPALESQLWQKFNTEPYELGTVLVCSSEREVFELLDVDALFRLLNKPVPNDLDSRLDELLANRLLRDCADGTFEIPRFSALLLAKSLNDFPTLARKAIRVVQYDGNDRVKRQWERTGNRGYASGFEGLIRFVNDRLPINEVMTEALRREVPAYPELAIRETVANALIHQDLAISGTSPMIEIFDDRIEVSNPGQSLLEVDRILNDSPRSRNEALARAMRLFGVCEEQGTGIDKIIFEIEFHQLPPPLFESVPSHTRVTMFSPSLKAQTRRVDRVRAVYQHACLRYAQQEHLTNASLRQRFGISNSNSAQASRYIREAIEDNQIRLFDERAAAKKRSYVPIWA